ncbi:malonyl-[acyl-carrier protein] O-methyltransferase BioC [Microbulbifer flavimaris]|uniref:Malonyl-[acyl-carrier protein] O-methyltransferase n=1 Tax=Microbulbifer flavimaris TaxID=1781068 RepID=A0ABX4HYL0_9GAMM|nr:MULTISPECIES: malonyl-ACP O-methyltransferase BioC [Microbulbifer]PCO04986.1 malonyl-[acyl-carrier protein] O-methyltransferase BioC [Microbulbifer flavimaris]
MNIDHLVFIHGWGCDGRIWQPLRAALEERLAENGLELPLTVLELPGFGDRFGERWPDGETLLNSLAERIPHDSLVVGHSLGGMLAVRLAARTDRVAGVITLAANARFTADPDWPGMATTTFADFCNAFAAVPRQTWQRFCGLQVQGDHKARALLKNLRALAPESSAFETTVAETTSSAATAGPWSAALGCLGRLDNRELLKELDKPQRHFLGANDALVPVEAAQSLSGLGVAAEVIDGAGHVLPLSQPQFLAAAIGDFILQARRGEDSSGSTEPFAKTAVARSFGRAATSYDAAAHLQRAVCRQLLSALPEQTEPRRILDLGSGTGYGSELLRQRFPSAEIVALDLAEGMLSFARHSRPAANAYIAADAEQLPLADNSFDLVFSSMALQWCYRLPALFAGLQRILTPDGRLLVSTLGPGTLWELRQAWARVDDGVHVNRFLPALQWSDAAQEAGLCGGLRTEERVLHYSTAMELMRDLKRIGAHNVNSGAGKGLTGRDRLRRLSQAYEPLRATAGLPASYEIFYLELHSSAGSVKTQDAGTEAGVLEVGQ